MRIYEEKINNVKNIAEEKIHAIRIEVKKEFLIAEEKPKNVKSEAENESLKLLYNIFSQEEYKESKKKILALKNSNVNNE